LEIGEWKADGQTKIGRKFIEVLDLSEYAMIEYKNGNGKNINFYVAYYESQSKGKSIHAPESCILGSGYTFDESGTVSISPITGNTDTMKISRAVIKYGKLRQISYYWFLQRGRTLSNFYQLKLYNFWDAFTKQRTDGALVRLITPVYETESLAEADIRLQNFVRDILPLLEEYIPGKELSQ
jgi:EpsI family protein